MSVPFQLLSQRAKSSVRLEFFEFLFQDYEGYVCIATTHQDAPKASFSQRFFLWPSELEKMEHFISSAEKKYNIYFCVNLLSEMERTKDRCLPTDLLWADFDMALPDSDKVQRTGLLPPLVIQSSPDRYQCIWRLTSRIDSFDAQTYSRRIAYAFDADKSGWDLTQLLRVPFTVNFKYPNRPVVAIERMLPPRAAPALFETLPPPPQDEIEAELEDNPVPEVNQETATNAIRNYASKLRDTSFEALFTREPDVQEDWSRILWKLIHVLHDTGMSNEQVYAIALLAKCNKYKRDGRPTTHLWMDVLRASKAHEELNILRTVAPLEMPELTHEAPTNTFITEYHDWAESVTDAVPAFHDLAAFILCSAIVSNSVRLATEQGPMVPNLWGLVLGDSTLTRKSTAMRFVMDMLNELDHEMIVATDGSPEGLLAGLAERPNRASVFFRDEVSGFFNSITKKDYLAGFAELLTQLYDAPALFQRKLKKETIRIENPAFVFFGGGVSGRVYDALNEEFVLSGFLPRFLVVNGETDMGRIRRTGPPTKDNTTKKAELMVKIANLYEQYATSVVTHIGGVEMTMPQRIEAVLSPEAWEVYGDIEELLTVVANSSSIPDLALPTFERLSRSLLKMAVVLGATRKPPQGEQIIVIEAEDVDNAAWYVQQWGQYSIELITNAGKQVSERKLDRIYDTICRYPGIMRSTLMTTNHMTKREADEIFSTLEERQKIRGERIGRTTRYWADK